MISIEFLATTRKIIFDIVLKFHIYVLKMLLITDTYMNLYDQIKTVT